MKVEFDESFARSLKKIREASVKTKVKALIQLLKDANSLTEVKGVKKMMGFDRYYRIRIGDYRLGLEQVDENMIILIILAHRKDIYRKFP